MVIAARIPQSSLLRLPSISICHHYAWSVPPFPLPLVNTCHPHHAHAQSAHPCASSLVSFFFHLYQIYPSPLLHLNPLSSSRHPAPFPLHSPPSASASSPASPLPLPTSHHPSPILSPRPRHWRRRAVSSSASTARRRRRRSRSGRTCSRRSLRSSSSS